MQPNVQKTKSFYESYVPCKCGDCKYLYANIERKYKELFDYLVALGIDPIKPIESMSYYESSNGIMTYTACYLVFGEIEENFSDKIGEVKIAENHVTFPYPEVEEPFFVLMIGELKFKRTVPWNRHMTKAERIHVIRNCISKEDPMGLIASGSPMDEYSPEAKKIDSFLCLKKSYMGLWKIIKKVLDKSFDESFDEKVCKAIAFNITSSLDWSIFESEAKEFPELKDKIIFNDDYSIELKIHDDFVVKWIDRNTYINDKFYGDIEEQDLIHSFIDFVKDDDTIYIQYKHKHLNFFNLHFREIKEISRKKFNVLKLKHKNDIEKIFDNKGIIENSKYK